MTALIVADRQAELGLMWQGEHGALLSSDLHGGWENNDGAYGEFCFDASARCIHLEFNERFTSSELFTHDF